MATSIRLDSGTATIAVSTLLGTVLASREIGTVMRLHKRATRVAFGGLLLIIMVGLVARVADVRFV